MIQLAQDKPDLRGKVQLAYRDWIVDTDAVFDAVYKQSEELTDESLVAALERLVNDCQTQRESSQPSVGAVPAERARQLDLTSRTAVARWRQARSGCKFLEKTGHFDAHLFYGSRPAVRPKHAGGASRLALISAEYSWKVTMRLCQPGRRVLCLSGAPSLPKLKLSSS